MREVTTHRFLLLDPEGKVVGHPDPPNDHVRVEAQDEKNKGGAPYTYNLWVRAHNHFNEVGKIRFHNGPLVEESPNGDLVTHEMNGVTLESLLVVIMDRLEHFQKGKFSCLENENALRHLNVALKYLKDRSYRRHKEGKQGRHEK